jgi:hypothetical protein
LQLTGAKTALRSGAFLATVTTPPCSSRPQLKLIRCAGQVREMTTYADDYFAAVERLVGRPEDRIKQVSNEADDGMPPACGLLYDDWPRAGVLTTFTLGAGLGLHVEAFDAHVELVVSLSTADPHWGLAAVYLTERCRNHLELLPGTTLNMGEPLSDESSMTGFIITKPHHWDAPPRLELSDRSVVILEAHPAYASELDLAAMGCRDEIELALTGPTYDPRRSAVRPRAR